MGNPVTLQTLITRVRQRGNLEGATAFITDAEIADCLNSSLANEVYDLLRLNVGEQYYRKTVSITTQQGVSSYLSPSDMLSLISIDVWLGGQYPVSAKRYYENQHNMLRAFPFGWNYTYPVYYSILGSGPQGSINFLSAPDAGYQVDINYCPVMTQLVNPNDTFDDVNGWSEIAVLDAATKCLIKSKQLETAEYLEARKEKLVVKVKAMSAYRHSGEPEQVNIIANRPQFGDGWLE